MYLHWFHLLLPFNIEFTVVQTEGKRKMEFEALANGYALLTFEGSVLRVVRAAFTSSALVFSRGVHVQLL
jgi:hypothetical protein